jgi:hypothetical protein
MLKIAGEIKERLPEAAMKPMMNHNRKRLTLDEALSLQEGDSLLLVTPDEKIITDDDKTKEAWSTLSILIVDHVVKSEFNNGWFVIILRNWHNIYVSDFNNDGVIIMDVCKNI